VQGLVVWLAAFGVIVGAAGGDPGPLRIVAAVPTGKHPAGVALASGAVWVANDVDNTVSRIDPATNAVTATIKLHGKNFPDPSVMTAGDGALWVVAPTTGTVSRLDLGTAKVTATEAVPGLALGITRARDAVWVTSFDPYRCSNNRCFSQLTRLDVRSGKVTGTFDAESASGIAAGFGSLWLVNHRSWSVTRFDPRTGRVVHVIPIRVRHEASREGPERVVVGLGSVWVSHPGQDIVTRIDPRTNTIAARVRFPRNAAPATLAVGAGSLWAVGPKQVFRIDLKTNRVVESARVGKHPGSDYHGLRSIAVGNGDVWVTDGDANTVDRIEVGS
jgi:YVTN family beta-propeller protein